MQKKTLALAVLLLVQGCAGLFGRTGVETREHVLLPAIEQAWPAVQEDIANGVDSAQGRGDLSSEGASNYHLRLGDWSAEMSAEDTRVSEVLALRGRDWGDFRFYALRGISAREAAGELGPVSAGELRERVTRFDEALAVLAGEPTDPSKKEE